MRMTEKEYQNKLLEALKAIKNYEKDDKKS